MAQSVLSAQQIAAGAPSQHTSKVDLRSHPRAVSPARVNVIKHIYRIVRDDSSGDGVSLESFCQGVGALANQSTHTLPPAR